MYAYRAFMRLCAIISGFIGIFTGTIMVALIVFELGAIIFCRFATIFWPTVFSHYEDHLVTDYIWLTWWGLGGILLFIFFKWQAKI